MADQLASLWARLDAKPVLAKIARNKIKFSIYLLVTLVSAFLVSRLLGDNFDVAHQKFRGAPTTTNRNVRQVNEEQVNKLQEQQQQQQQQQQVVDPFASRPRIATRNGHLIFEASADKNIDFKTSGSRGSVTINGLKLDQLVGAARALERLSSSASAAGSGDAGGLSVADFANDSLPSSISAARVQQRHEMVLRTLFGAAEKLKRLDERQSEMSEGQATLRERNTKLANKLGKAWKQLGKLGDQLGEVLKKLKENNCVSPVDGLPVCKNGAECIDLYDSYKCLCPREYEGAQCQLDVDECAKFRGTELGCQNGGRCVNMAGGYRCECPAAFHGIHCTEQHDDCALASSSSMCGHGKCVNLARSQPNQPAYECICDQGWTADESGRSPACVIDINECLAGQVPAPGVGGPGNATPPASYNVAYPCSQNPWVECINLPGSFVCGPCPPGYQGNGRVCRDVDECLVNNGGCSRSPLVECFNLPGSRRCGPCPPGHTSQDDSQTCERVGACQLEPNGGCHPMATCVELKGVANQDAARLCVCQYPFVGSGVGQVGCSRVGTPTLPVAPDGGGGGGGGEEGGNGSSPTGSDMTSASGRLVPSFMLNTTNIKQDDCRPNPCLNGGQCIYGDATFECVCPPSWTGRLCESEANFACGGRFSASQGVFQFPTGPIKFVQFPTSAVPGRSKLAQVTCTWTIGVPADKSVQLDISHLTIRRPASGHNERVQVHVFNLTSADGGGGGGSQVGSPSPFSRRASHEQPPDCSEHLDVRQRQEEALETTGSGASSRLLARICVVPLAATSGVTKETETQQAVTLIAESNLVELEYSLQTNKASLPKKEQVRADATASADTQYIVPLEGRLSFQLTWSKTEPACGGELPVATSGSISSPRFPEFYAPGTECRYLLRVPPGQRIRLQFGELNLLSFNRPLTTLAAQPGGGVCADSLTILDGALGFDRPVLFRHCANEQRASSWGTVTGGSASGGQQQQQQPLVSSSSTVEIVLSSRPESSVPLMRPKQKRGFYLTFAAEDTELACGGLYTTKTALIKSSDYEPGEFGATTTTTGSGAGGLEDSALAYEYANYFDLNDNSSNYFNFRDSLVGTMLWQSSPDGAPRSSSSSSGSSGGGTTTTASPRSARLPWSQRGEVKQHHYNTRCEYEIRPADQARNHRVQIDWLDMPSEIKSDAMSSLSKWSRRVRCMHSRLLVFDGHPAASAPAAAAATASSLPRDSSTADNVTRPQQTPATATAAAASNLLATFCSGDKYNASMPQLQPIASSGHLLFLIYESMAGPEGGSDGATFMADIVASGSRGGKPPAGGFRLRYSTRCSAIYRQLEGEIQTELDAEVDECLYHIVLPPNNTVSLQIEPMLAPPGAASGTGQDLASLTLPDGSCAVQAVFMDGAVPRGPLALAQTERQLRFFHFSSGAFSSADTDSASREASPSAAAAAADTLAAAAAAAGAATGVPAASRVVSQSDYWVGLQEPEASTGSSSTNSSTTSNQQATAAVAASNKYAFWQYGSSRVHDIKEFDVCHLPALGFDSSYNEISLMFRLNPKISLRKQAQQVAPGATDSSSGPFGISGLPQLKFLIKYSSENACGGIVSEPREGSIELVASRYNSNLSQYLQVPGGSFAEGFLAHLFTNECSWILRNPRPGQQILINFERVPTAEISKRMSDWIQYLHSGAETAATTTKRPFSTTTTTTTRAPTTTVNSTVPTTSDDDSADELATSGGRDAHANGNLANCSQAFQELIEFYEPSTGRSRFVCPSELVEQPTLHWTSLSDTLYVRLLNDTTRPKPGAPRVWEGRKPLAGPPIRLSYTMLAHREVRSCGGKLMQSSGTIQTPRFPFNYAPNSNCVWIIQAPRPDQQVRLNFTRFHMEDHSSCLFDNLEIRNGPTDKSPLMGRFCGKTLAGRVLVSQSSMVYLRFRSDAHLNRQGFQLLFDAASTGCGGLLTAPRGQIDSPNYPLAYAHGADCEWTIEVATGSRVSLHVEDLDVKLENDFCNSSGPKASYLEILDDQRALGSWRSLGRWCHLSDIEAAATTIESTSNRMHIIYRAQGQDQGKGFRLTYSTSCVFEHELTGTSGVIESPGYPSAYDASHCTWVVRAPLGSNVSVAITDYAADETHSTDPLDGLFPAGFLSSLGSSRERTWSPKKKPGTRRPSEKSVRLDVRPTTKCPGGQMQLRFWSARVINASVPMAERLEAFPNWFMGLFERKQLRVQNMTSYYNFTRSIYNFTLERNLCRSKLDDNDRSEMKFFDIPSNVLIVHQQATPQFDQPRRFRLEWRARQACGGPAQTANRHQQQQQQQLPPSYLLGQQMHSLQFDERLDLTRWQANQPIECIWSLSASVGSRPLEYDLRSDMHAVGATMANNCNDTSLTLYDGLAPSAPMLYQNCAREGTQHEAVFPQSGHLLVRYLSSGRHGGDGGALGTNFALYGWAGHRDGCSVSVFEIDTPFLELAGSRTSPNYPEMYEDKAYRCSSIISTSGANRLRFNIVEINIPLDSESQVDWTSYNPMGFSDPKLCQLSGSYLRLRSGQRTEIFCGHFDALLAESVPKSLERRVVVTESSSAMLDFFSKGGGGGSAQRGRWKVTWKRLCGASIKRLSVNEEFATPNYPARPQWPANSANGPQANEQVCIWRISLSDNPGFMGMLEGDESAATSKAAAAAAGAGSKLLFNLMDFSSDGGPAATTPIPTSAGRGGPPRDCLRLYEGYNISLAQSAFNLTDMDARLEPKLRVCSRADLAHNSMLYVSRGSEIVIMTTGLATAKFRVRNYENFCGGDFLAPDGEFATPNYPTPYANDLDCHYFIFGSPGARISLKFDAFDLGAPATLADDATGGACDTSDYVEVRQLSAKQRVMIKLRGLLANRSYKGGVTDPTPGSDQAGESILANIDVGDFLAARSQEAGRFLLQDNQLAASVARNETKTSKTTTKERRLGAIKKSLNRLLQLAHLFYLFEEAPDGAAYAKLNRVRGHNNRLSVKLEDFYAASTLVGRYCGKRVPQVPGDLLHDELLIRFRSHGLAVAREAGGATQQQPRGFLARYKLNYGQTASTDSESLLATTEWDYLSSPSYPERQVHDAPLTWAIYVSRNLPEQLIHYMIEFELISLTLGSTHSECQDSLSVYGGTSVSNGDLLVRWCGHLSFKRLLDRGMDKLWSSALEGSLNARKLPVNLAHEPRVQADLLRRVRTTGSQSLLVLENHKSRGAFLLRYRAVKKIDVEANIDESDEPEPPLGEEEALASQFGSGSMADLAGEDEAKGGSSTCSRIYRLAVRNSGQLNDSVVLSSPGWPGEVHERELECHWLVTTSDNTNIALQFDPSALSSSQAGDFSTSRSGTGSSEYCFKKQPNSAAQAVRNFVVVHDGASTLAPILGRYCLPAPPVQLRSTGRHLLVRYVHAEPLPDQAAAAAATSDDQPAYPVGPRTSLFSALAHVGRCGGQYHIMYQESIRDGLSSATETPVGGGGASSPGGAKWQIATAQSNQLTCLYYLFASDPNNVLTIHAVLSELKFAKAPATTAKPMNATVVECPTTGDYLEVRDLPIQSDNFDFSPEAATSGRLLGRFCAARPLSGTLESLGPALVLQFRVNSRAALAQEQQHHRSHFNLLVTSGEPRSSCPRTTLKLTPEQPYARLMSPGWPHGFAGARRCKYHLSAPPGRAIALALLRLRRPRDSANSSVCLDTLSVLDDSEAAGVRYEYRPLAELRAPISGSQLRQLVQKLPCANDEFPSLNLDPFEIWASGADKASATQTKSGGNSQATKRLADYLPEQDFTRLTFAMRPFYVLRSESDQLLVEYSAKNLQPMEGFAAVVSLADMPRERRCGGEIEAKPGHNLLESAGFGKAAANNGTTSYTDLPGGSLAHEDLIHCHWRLKFDSAASREMSVFGNPSAWANLDLVPGLPATISNGSLPPPPPQQRATNEFKTSFLVFQALELAPLVQNTSLIEEQYGNHGGSGTSELCGLNRLLITDHHYYHGILACGYLTNKPEAMWTFVDEITSSEVLLRAHNLERVVYDQWYEPPRDLVRSQLEGRTKLHRGMRAYFFESSCAQAERVPGELMRIRSHTGFWVPPRQQNATAASQQQQQLRMPTGSYQPGICKWAVRLRPGHYEISFKGLNLRSPPPPPSSSRVISNGKQTTTKCSLDNDYLELRASGELDSPVLARYCANNQLEATKHNLPINSTLELTILFVAGLARLREGKDKFEDAPSDLLERPPGAEMLEPEAQTRRPAAAAASTQVKPTYGFEMQVIKVRNSTLGEFCRRDSNYNIYQLIRNHERTIYYGSDYYSGTIAPNSLYPRNTHCSIDMSIDDNFRFNLTFSSFFDLEPSRDCQSDYLEISELVEKRPTSQLTTSKPTTSQGKPPKTINRRLSTTTTTSKPRAAANGTTTARPAMGKSPSKVYEKTSLNLYQDLEPRRLGRWCGRNIPKGSFLTSTSKIRIVFHSNERIEGKGFILEWSAVPAVNQTIVDDDDDQ